jgi:hypothetical protein
VLVGGILAAVVVAGFAAVAVMRRRSQDDEHSVEHYHQRLHTLEELRTHPVGRSEGEENGHDDAAFPASAFRVSGSSTVRLTDAGHTIVPPVPPPPVPNPKEPVTFDDGPPDHSAKPNFSTGIDEKALHSINRRPRRLGGPLAAVGAVAVLIVVLIVTGLHTNNPPKHGRSTGTATTATTAPARAHQPRSGAGTTGRHKKTTATTAPPAVSGPSATSQNGANYQVADASYSLALSAKNGECWISATEASNGAVLFTGVLSSGQSHTVTATGPVTVVAGAPAAFAATINGVAVQLPFGFQAPFTLKFLTPAGAAGSTSNGSATTTTTAANAGSSG